MVSAKIFTAVAAALAASFVSAEDNCTAFDAAKPFTLHTEVIKGPADFNNFYLTAFHVGAAQQTVVGTRNASKSIGWVLEDAYLQQPISVSSGSLPPYNLTLLPQAPVRSSAPAGYDYISLSYSGSTTGFSLSASNSSTAVIQFDSAAAANTSDVADYEGFALCYVNGTSPYFTLGPQYQLLWKTAAAAVKGANYTACADVELVAHNID